MTYKVVIPIKKMSNGKWGKTPSLNEYISAERVSFRNRNGKMVTKGSIMKKEWQRYFGLFIRKYLPRVTINKPILVHYHYYEPDHKRDYGNIHAPVQKYFEDALQEYGIILNDNQKYIRGFTAEFDIDKVNPRIEIEMEEI